jgi:hypothetical protein
VIAGADGFFEPKWFDAAGTINGSFSKIDTRKFNLDMEQIKCQLVCCPI